MSADVVLHALGLEEFQLLEVVENKEEATLEVHVYRPDAKRRCPVCGSQEVVKRGRVQRRAQTVPLGAFRIVFVVFHLHRLYCRACDRTLTERVEMLRGKNRWTVQLAEQVLELVDKMNLQSIAWYLRMSWDTVKKIHAQWLRHKARQRYKDLSALRYLAIDELAIRKGHRYVTVVLDLERRRPVWVGKGRGNKALEPFYKLLAHRGIAPVAVAMDMWPTYTELTMKYFPSALIVYDRFHIVANANKALDETRRLLAREADILEAKAIKGTRWVLLRNAERLANNPKAQEKLQLVARFNEPLYHAYLLKEQLRELWDTCRNDFEARDYLHDWIQQATSSSVYPMVRFARTIAAHRCGILNWFSCRISTGPLEGLNNKIKVLKRNAYGYRDRAYFTLRILFINEAKHVFVG